MLRSRILTAAALVPLTLVALYALPPIGWAVVTLAVMLVAASEWAKLIGCGRVERVLFVAGVLAIGADLLFVDAAGFDHGWPDRVILAICGAATLFWLALAPLALAFPARGIWRLPAVLAGWLVLVGAWVALVQLQASAPSLALAAMALVWVADTAAYFSGRAFGRHRLAASISPGKTWEGVAGAVAVVALYALALSPLAREAGFSGRADVAAIAGWVAIAIALALISVVGDLFESMLKRRAGVKDSGRVLPGHGGVLDRIDALLATLPPSALLATVFLR